MEETHANMDANTSSAQKPKFNPMIVVITIVALGLIGYGLMKARGDKDDTKKMDDKSPVADTKSMDQADLKKDTEVIPTTVEDPKAMMNTNTNVKEFTVSGQNFSFDPSEIKVTKGDTVKITFKNTDSMHDWRIDEFNAHTNQIKTGETETIQFVADKAGTFEYYCSVGKHRDMGMKGKLIVADK